MVGFAMLNPPYRFSLTLALSRGERGNRGGVGLVGFTALNPLCLPVVVYPNVDLSYGFIRGMGKDGYVKRFPLPLGEGQGEGCPERA